MPAAKKSSFLEFALLFAVVFLGTQFIFNTFFPQKNGQELSNVIELKPVDASIKEGHHPEINLVNHTAESFILQSRCPMPPVEVYKVNNPKTADEELKKLTTEEHVLPCQPTMTIESGKTAKINLSPWKYSLFNELGTYEVRLITDTSAEDDSGSNVTAETRFKIYEAGAVTQLFRNFISKPLLNLLIYIASVLPGNNLGWAIIILTVIVKLILFFPTQHALEGQKQMQKLQPKLEEIKKKYKDNPQQMQQETVKVWKENKINPFQSCLPLLLQFPILIGLFFVIRDGSFIELSRHLLYTPFQNLEWTFGHNFFGLNLLEPNFYIMPPALMILQFLQMKLSFAIAKKKKANKEKVIDVTPKEKRRPEKEKPAAPSMQETQQKVMLYGLPLMIGFFALQFPTAVSLYWGISTLFAIGQQLVVNRKNL